MSVASCISSPFELLSARSNSFRLKRHKVHKVMKMVKDLQAEREQYENTKNHLLTNTESVIEANKKLEQAILDRQSEIGRLENELSESHITLKSTIEQRHQISRNLKNFRSQANAWKNENLPDYEEEAEKIVIDLEKAKTRSHHCAKQIESAKQKNSQYQTLKQLEEKFNEYNTKIYSSLDECYLIIKATHEEYEENSHYDYLKLLKQNIKEDSPYYNEIQSLEMDFNNHTNVNSIEKSESEDIKPLDNEEIISLRFLQRQLQKNGVARKVLEIPEKSNDNDKDQGVSFPDITSILSAIDETAKSAKEVVEPKDDEESTVTIRPPEQQDDRSKAPRKIPDINSSDGGNNESDQNILNSLLSNSEYPYLCVFKPLSIDDDSKQVHRELMLKSRDASILKRSRKLPKQTELKDEYEYEEVEEDQVDEDGNAKKVIIRKKRQIIISNVEDQEEYESYEEEIVNEDGTKTEVTKRRKEIRKEESDEEYEEIEETDEETGEKRMVRHKVNKAEQQQHPLESSEYEYEEVEEIDDESGSKTTRRQRIHKNRARPELDDDQYEYEYEDVEEVDQETGMQVIVHKKVKKIKIMQLAEDGANNQMVHRPGRRCIGKHKIQVKRGTKSNHIKHLIVPSSKKKPDEEGEEPNKGRKRRKNLDTGEYEYNSDEEEDLETRGDINGDPKAFARQLAMRAYGMKLDRAQLEVEIATNRMQLDDLLHEVTSIRDQIKIAEFEEKRRAESKLTIDGVISAYIPPTDIKPVVTEIESQTQMMFKDIDEISNRITENNDFIARAEMMAQNQGSLIFKRESLKKQYNQKHKELDKLKSTYNAYLRRFHVVRPVDGEIVLLPSTEKRRKLENMILERQDSIHQIQYTAKENTSQNSKYKYKIEDQKCLHEMIKKKIAELMQNKRPNVPQLTRELKQNKINERLYKERLKMLQIEEGYLDDLTAQVEDKLNYKELKNEIEEKTWQIKQIKKIVTQKAVTTETELKELEKRDKEVNAMMTNLNKNEVQLRSKIELSCKMISSYRLRVPRNKYVKLTI